MSTSASNYKFLTRKPKSVYKQLFIKERWISARTLYGMYVNEDMPMTAEEIAADYDLPLEAVLEAIALEGYRSGRLSEAEICQLLGYETRMEVHGFLKEHEMFQHYCLEDLEHDTETAHQIADRVRMERGGDLPGQRRAG